MNKLLISIVGDQPQPAYFFQRHYYDNHSRSTDFRLIATQRSKPIAERIGNLLKDKGLNGTIWDECDAYDVAKIHDYLQCKLPESEEREVIWDLTGGTKAMTMTAQSLAMIRKDRIVYLQSEGGKSKLHHLTTCSGVLQFESTEELDDILTIDDYFRLQGHDFEDRTSKQDDRGKRYEEAIEKALKENSSFEVRRGVAKGNLDIDFVIRKSNRIAIIEAKSGKNEIKKAIGQLMSASHPENYGTYVTKIVISAHPLDKEKNEGNNRNNTEGNNQQLAKACNIKTILLPFENDEIDENHLLQELNKILPQ